MDINVNNAISLHPYPAMISHESTPTHQTSAARHAALDRAGTSTALEAENVEEEPATRRSMVSADDEELERQPQPSYNRENDPLLLSSRQKRPDEISDIRKNISRRNSLVGTLNLSKEAAKAKRVCDFYEEQNKNIVRLLKPVELHRKEAKDLSESNALRYKIAVHASFAANICLAILQLYGAISSGSLSLFTTMADALFDPMSNLTLLLCNRAVKNVNPRKFPASLSCGDLVGRSCRTQWKVSNNARSRNDIIINGVGLCTSILGSKIRWYIDPIGAICLALLIITLWLRTAVAEFQLLVGVTANTAILQHITYISMTHSPNVKSLDTVRAWHSGPRLIVEVDIVMNADDTLRFTHDVAEELQTKLENLPNVDRAYVHVDYETDHAPEHFLKKEL
ncbi:MAG: hypothetical protein Q9159_002128 [Coniocarpon cinnabarinum]